MRTGGFRFAVVLSLALAAAAVAVAADLPPAAARPGRRRRADVRPAADHPAAGLPDRRASRAPSGAAASPARLPRTLVAVVRERWPLGARPLRAGRARRVVPHLRGVPEPQELRAVRQPQPVGRHARATSTGSLWLGHDPATVLHHVFGTGWAAQFFSFVYVAWIVFVPVSLVVALVWSRDRTGGAWYVTAVAVDWVLGVATYFAVPTLGPGLRPAAGLRGAAAHLRHHAPGDDDPGPLHRALRPVRAPTPCRRSRRSRRCTSGSWSRCA